MATFWARDAPRIILQTDFATLKINKEEGNVASSSSTKGAEARTEQ